MATLFDTIVDIVNPAPPANMTVQKALDVMKEARIEIERLRHALQRIADAPYEGSIPHAQRIARETLGDLS